LGFCSCWSDLLVLQKTKRSENIIGL
jgi:hypothetical protein